MTDRKDPESTRCTLNIETMDANLIKWAAPGDRVSIYETTADGQHTGYVVTARILCVARFPLDDMPAPRVVPPHSN